MKLFETAWKEKYEFYERVYDTQLKKSVKRKITTPYEWYEPYSKGLYTYILDETIKLDKKQGHSLKNTDGAYGILNPIYRNIRDNYWGKDQYNTNGRVWYLDIETRVGTCSKGFPVPEKALEPISLIQIFDSELDMIIMIGVRDWKHQENYKLDYKYKYITCADEMELINTFLALYAKLDPLIVYAWNGLGFDYPYIYNRLKKLGVDTNKLSNYGNVKLTQSEYQGKQEFKFESDGHHWLDMMDIYKYYVFSPRPSYSLDNIAEIELKENKVDHSEYSTFDDFYTGGYNIPENPTDEQKNSLIYQEAVKGNWEEVKELAHSDFCYYGYKDPLLIKKLDDKLKFTSLMFMIVDKMGVLIGDALATIKPWAQYIGNKSMLENKVMPPRQNHDSPSIVGGYVRDPNVGKHKWILSADVNSMYPLLGMVGFNMSPETYIPKSKLPSDLRDVVLTHFNDQEEDNRFEISDEMWNHTTKLLQEHNMSLGVNGAVFDRNNLGIVPELVMDIYTSRKKAKKVMFKYQQQAVLIKDILNKRG